MPKTMFEPRTYRRNHAPEGLVAFTLKEGESDLYVAATRSLKPQALPLLHEARAQLTDYLASHPAFLTALSPLPDDPFAPALVRSMLGAALLAGVGPMAAVAGAIAQHIGRGLRVEETILENGGDLYLRLARPRAALIDAGPHSPFAGRFAIEVGPGEWGLCTSSGTRGHSRSFGHADAAVVLCHDAALADAVATALGNRIVVPGDVGPAVEWALSIPGVTGTLGMILDQVALAGDIRLRPAT
nr:UPF0280 family protein [bacterium]